MTVRRVVRRLQECAKLVHDAFDRANLVPHLRHAGPSRRPALERLVQAKQPDVEHSLRPGHELGQDVPEEPGKTTCFGRRLLLVHPVVVQIRVRELLLAVH